MTDTTITPALTRKQWDATDPASVGPRRMLDGATALFGTDGLHPLAALCLHGQPFGFTQEDVDACRSADDEEWAKWQPQLAALAEKIAALLPPAA